MPETRSSLRYIVASLSAMLLLWQVIVWLSDAPHYILPGPLLVAQAMVENAALIAEHTWITALEIVIGLILGTLLGMATAIYLMMSPRYCMPVLVLSQAVPVFALAPVLTLWFGYGLLSKVVMAILIIYFPIASTFHDGLRNTPPAYLDLAHNMQASPFDSLLQLRIPAAIPALCSGIRLATVYAPIGAIIGEWVGGSKGLGYLMLLANGRLKIDLMFAALIVLCCFTMLFRGIAIHYCKKLEYWAGQ